ncbi:hypothetical protein Ciccas_006522 [Cichlidogyrus casuarinus]|uniref:non-specific serine/threonine protein kinase n=1 Tax=Cichlidogyrus casuarinus TaxID=1844966 RepID=A0ABD2Q6N6_9PLAT
MSTQVRNEKVDIDIKSKPVDCDNQETENVNKQLLKAGELVKDRWRVLQKLGGGGFGEIYEAVDTWADAFLHKYPNRYLCQTCLNRNLDSDIQKSVLSSPNSVPDSGFSSDQRYQRLSSAGTTTSCSASSRLVNNTPELPTPRSLSGKTVPISPVCINCAAEMNPSLCSEDPHASCSDSSYGSFNLDHYRVAIKAESSKQPRQVLRMEVAVLRRLKARPQICQLLGCGKNTRINYMVMTLEGKNLAELRKSVPKGVFSLGTTFRIILQCLHALKTLHEVGFLHRDIKPSNFTIGRGTLEHGDPHVKLLDFGLARAYTVSGSKQLRPPRPIAGFRGTVRYASMNAHKQQDLSRYDDIWSLTYMLLEFIDGNLPWRRVRDKDEVGKMKMEANNFKLALNMGLPEKISSVWIGQLELMDFYSKPDYRQLDKVITDWLGENPPGCYDWQTETLATVINDQEPPKLNLPSMDPSLPPLTPRKQRPPLSSIRNSLSMARIKQAMKSTSMHTLGDPKKEKKPSQQPTVDRLSSKITYGKISNGYSIVRHR